MAIDTIFSTKSFGGTQSIYSHISSTTSSDMRFGLFLPTQADTTKVPILYWLSGLTCTEENFIIKAGAQRVAQELGIAIITPDTSPRNLNLPGETESYDVGAGASFYVDATENPWSRNYKMYSYIVNELTSVVRENFPIDETRVGIFGHSMGGHGALTIAIRNSIYFKTVSAFAPICSPVNCPWGQKAFTTYLGNNRQAWQTYDACALIANHGWSGPSILVDQGTNDPYLEEQLKPTLLTKACKAANVQLNLRMQAGYDHSYFFIASFIEEHLRFHAQHLIDNIT